MTSRRNTNNSSVSSLEDQSEVLHQVLLSGGVNPAIMAGTSIEKPKTGSKKNSSKNRSGPGECGPGRTPGR